MIGYTGPVRRGHSLLPHSSNGLTVESITQPCPTCGQDAIAQTYDSMRKDGVYRVTQLRCPSANTRKQPKNSYEALNKSKAPKCPIHTTEIKIGDTPMPVQKICTVIPKPEDQAEYKRLKAALGIENKEFIELCLLTNATVYDWFAGRAISPTTEAKILFAIKELQKREGKPVVKPSNGSKINPDDLAQLQPPLGNNLPEVTRLDAVEDEVKNLARTLSEKAQARLDNLHLRMGAMCERIDTAEAEINGLAKSVSHIEDEMEQLERIQFNPPLRDQAAKAQLCVDLLTPMSPGLLDCILNVVKANRQLAQAVAL